MYNKENLMYFKWINGIIRSTEFGRFNKILKKLFSTEFKYVIANDANRYDDGLNLKYKFAWEHNDQNKYIIEMDLGNTCSMLEMMVALAMRCENNMRMSDEDDSYLWFWGMMDNLGLIIYDDEHYDDYAVDVIIDRFMNREYNPNGEGGLFIVDNAEDLRNVEIWYQMNWYFNAVCKGLPLCRPNKNRIYQVRSEILIRR